MDVDQVSQAVGEFNHIASRCQLNMTPALQRCEKENEIAGAVAFILLVVFGHYIRSGRQGRTALFGQLFPALIQTDDGPLAILLLVIDRKRIFHGADELCTHCLWYTPTIFQQRFKVVFLSVVRNVSRDILSTTSHSTSLSACICWVHCSRPSGAALHTSCTNRASPAQTNTRGRFRFGRVWVRAASMPTVTHYSRTRSTTRPCEPNALAISASLQPPPSYAPSAIKRVRTRLKRRPDPLPVFTCLSNSLRYSSVNRTRYRFAGIFPLPVASLLESVRLFAISGNPYLLHH